MYVKLLVGHPSAGHRLLRFAGAIALASCALLSIVGRAQASGVLFSETLYWENFDQHPATIGFAPTGYDGGGFPSGEIVPNGAEIQSPEGMAFDSDNHRIYVASSGSDEIIWVNINDGTAGALKTGAAPVDKPEGVAVDPKTQTVYWGNANGPGSIGYAAADGSDVGGTLNRTGASPGAPERIALDPEDGRVYWLSSDGPGETHLSYANLDDTGGGNVSVPEEELPEEWTGINVDPATQRIYILAEEEFEIEPGEFESENFVYWVSLSGIGGGEVDTSAASFAEPFGMAYDPSSGRFYWGNYGYGLGALPIGIATLPHVNDEPGIYINETMPVGPQDPIVLKSPYPVESPKVTGSGSTLNCSTGGWSQDYVGSYVYGAPESFTFEWINGALPIVGATESTLDAPAPGTYRCLIMATNQFGKGIAQSNPYTVSPPAVPETKSPPAQAAVPPPASVSVASLTKKNVEVEAGKAALLPLTLKNAGGTASSSSSACVTLTKKAKKGLVAPKCVAVAAIAPGASKTVTLKVKTKGGAKGTYKFSVVVSGASGSTTLAEQLTVTPKKKHHKKHGKK
jgi:DNA-binding beta-propeller fold protein YncE